MMVVSIILGILLVIGGFSCLFTPLATFLSAGHFITILLLVYGVLGIVRFCTKKAGGLEFFVSILAVIAGVVALTRPGRELVNDRLLLYIIASWLFVQGAVSIILAIQARHERRGWFWGVIVGILGVLAGVYSFAHPILTAVTAGVLIGFYFIQTGFDMIVLGCAVGAVRDAVEEDE